MIKSPVVTSLEEASFYYNLDQTIINSISFELRSSETLALIGPSGSGKTTLFRLITGEKRPSQGSVELFGKPIAIMTKNELMDVRTHISIMFQHGALFTDKTVQENIAFPLEHIKRFSHLSKSDIKDKVLSALDGIGLSSTKHLMPNELSGGMVRRIAFLRAAITEPKLMLLDEPFVGQDPISISLLSAQIEALQATGTAMIIISHDIPELMKVSDKCMMVYLGEKVFEGSKDDLATTTNSYVKQFVSGEIHGPIATNRARDML